jgi:RNA polymerase sigma-70 factor (ECF subfamily)
VKEEEQKIIGMLKQGHNAAYKYIYDHYYTLLCAIVYEYLKDSFLSEIMVDDLIFHLWEKRETLEITTSLRSYLVRAIRNRCLNYLKLERERKEVTFSSIDTKEHEIMQYSESPEYPLAVLLENELEEKINQSIENLPENCRNVFRKSRFEKQTL